MSVGQKTDSMVSNIYKYDLPLKNFMNRMGTQEAGSVANARYPYHTVLN
tara:strand:+ start:105 stop:251 length:147 start_codon:yes stop_codon:yes gene_type:complete